MWCRSMCCAVNDIRTHLDLYIVTTASKLDIFSIHHRFHATMNYVLTFLEVLSLLFRRFGDLGESYKNNLHTNNIPKVRRSVNNGMLSFLSFLSLIAIYVWLSMSEPYQPCRIVIVQYQMCFFNWHWPLNNSSTHLLKNNLFSYPSALFDHHFTPRKTYTKFLWIIQKLSNFK